MKLSERKTLCCMLCSVNLQYAYDMLKASMLVYNFLFMMLSVFIIGLGCYAEYMRSKFTEQEHFLVTPSIFLLVIGSLMLVFSFPGFIGALRDNTFMLKIFTISVTLCVLLEISGAIIAFLAKPYKQWIADVILIQ